MATLSEEEFLGELEALQVPTWSSARFLENTEGCSATFLGSGFYGEVELLSDARRSLVVKRMTPPSKESFLQEVEALAKVRGIEGAQ